MICLVTPVHVAFLHRLELFIDHIEFKEQFEFLMRFFIVKHTIERHIESNLHIQSNFVCIINNVAAT